MPVMSAEDLQDFLRDHFPQIEHLNMRVEHVDDRRIRVRMRVTDQHLRPGGTVSGPTLMALADATMWLLVLAQIGPVALAVTTSLNINFLNKPDLADVIAEAALLKLGKRLAVGDVILRSAARPEPVAQATITYSIPPEGSEARKDFMKS